MYQKLQDKNLQKMLKIKINTLENVLFQKISIPLPWKVFQIAAPNPFGNSILVPYFHSKNWAFETPLPFGISINLPWGRHGYFLELHNDFSTCV